MTRLVLTPRAHAAAGHVDGRLPAPRAPRDERAIAEIGVHNAGPVVREAAARMCAMPKCACIFAAQATRKERVVALNKVSLCDAFVAFVKAPAAHENTNLLPHAVLHRCNRTSQFFWFLTLHLLVVMLDYRTSAAVPDVA
jgi:hypothetical protein